MAMYYQRVVDIIKKPCTERQQSELKLCESWFRKKSNILKALKQETLLDLIKHCEFVTKQADDVIIRQGDKGHRFYIILRGSVSIVIKDNQDDLEPSEEGEKRPAVERSALGNHIVSLGEGTTFGEIALINPDCIRTASVVADEMLDLVIIHRDLYNRSVSKVVAREYAEKINFIDSMPIFRHWNPKFKKSLAASFKKETFPFDCTICKQGDPAANMYFIVSGEVKLVVDPEAHFYQFETFMNRCGTAVIKEEKAGDHAEKAYFPQKLLPQLAKFTRVHKASRRQRPSSASGVDPLAHLPQSWSPSSIRKMNLEINSRKVNLSLCYLGAKQELGDVEFIVGLDAYHASAVCSQETNVFTLQRCHFDRLFRKKNPRTIKEMAQTLELQLARRIIKPYIVESTPLLKCIVYRLQEFGQDGKRSQTSEVGTFHLPEMTFDTRKQDADRLRESRSYTWHSARPGPESDSLRNSLLPSGSGADSLDKPSSSSQRVAPGQIGIGPRSKTIAMVSR